MDNSKAIVSSLIVAMGTIMSAIGSTPSNILNSDLRNSLNLWGNVLQAGGNALQANGQGNILRTVGKEFQSIGNVTVISGLLLDLKKETAQKIFITGNWIQALGGAINVGHGIELNPFPGHSENIIGNVLQFIGNSLQAFGGVYELEKNGNTDNNFIEHNNGNSLHAMVGSYQYGSRLENYKEHNNGESFIVTGSWIQSIGSVFSVIGTIKEEYHEKQLESQLNKN
jgi:hypothetical protein